MSKPHERVTPIRDALANSMAASVRCAIKNGLKLHDINGHAEEWCRHLRNQHGDRPTTDDFYAEWERQLTAMAAQPCGPVEDE